MTGKQQIDAAIREFGTNTVSAPPEAILWAAAKCSNPRAALKAANKARQRQGAPLAHAPYGHPAF